jgi:hypothetical protein
MTTLLLVLLVVASHPSFFLFVFFVLYATSGMVRAVPAWQKRHPTETTEQPTSGPH